MFDRLSKYRQVFILSWENGFIYRLNFIMWRFRMVLQLLAVYFLWLTVLNRSPNAFGYTSAEFLTYILGTSFVRAFVFSSKSTSVQSDIGSGDLNNHLIRPINYFGYWLSQDIADKVLNLLFAIGEISLVVVILQPRLVPAPTWLHLIFFIIGAVLAMFLYYYLSLAVSLSTFWMPEGDGWPQRFFIFTLLEFFSGGLFPLDILPGTMRTIVTHLPFAYLLNFPMQIYLGRLAWDQIAFGLLATVFWIYLFQALARYLFKRGLLIYGAYGR